MNINCRKLLVIVSLLAALLIQSCSDDAAVVKPGEEGFFILNEGGFPNENASLSFYDREINQVTNNMFATANGRQLGIQAQSLTVFEGKAYIIVQGSAKIEVIDADDYSSIATITDEIDNPRYFIGISSAKGYVSDWGADGLTGTIKVIDLTTNEVTKSIPTGQGANKMLKINNLVYVTNNGGYGYDNTVKIIDSNTDAITETITVGDNPNSILSDADGNLWVSSSGAIAYNDDWSVDEANSTKGAISKITSNAEVLRLEMAAVSYGGAGGLSISPDGKTLYYQFEGNIFSMSTASTSLPTSAFASNFYYGFSVDPFSGNVIGTVAPNFSSAGSIEVMDKDGSLIDTFTVGIGPNGCYFK
ncbi:MAG: hypothetical protein R2820_05475 [Cyclobacteriaceae bacterium]